MSHELICSWLKLPADHWPPDHYTLLGLERGEKDLHRIEHSVQERLECLRRYQLRNPEPVTEAMNCLARAYCCLSDPEAKKRYDHQFKNGKARSEPVAAADPLAWLSQEPTPEAPAVDAPDLPDLAQAQVVDWSTAPPPARIQPPPAEEELLPIPEPAPELLPIPVAEEKPTPAVLPGPVWRESFATRRALLERISQTRRLLRAWQEAGRFLGQPQQRLTRRHDALHLVRQLGLIRKLLHGLPPLLGQAGQPGYLVIALGRQPLILQTFLTLLPSQREALARDWQMGQDLLAHYRRFLKHELMRLRQRTRTARAANAVSCYCGRHIALGLMAVLLVTLNLAFPLPPWLLATQAVLILSGAGIDWLRHRHARRRAWLQRRPAPRTPNPRRPQPQAS
jgi:hypothetical protein